MIRPRIVAHRGGGALAPENTLAAIRNALRLGADAVEVDVLRSRDGHLVVHHDERLTRTAGVPEAVWDLDLEELRQLDVGRSFSPVFAGQRIPTLEEVAAELPVHVRLIADFKHGEERFPGVTEQVADFARAFGPSRFAVLSIQHAFALRVTERQTAVLPLFTYRAPCATEEALRALRDLPPAVGFAASMRALSAGMLVAARETNRPVYLFTPNTPAELGVALEIGVDAVITDRVDLALELRRGRHGIS